TITVNTVPVDSGKVSNAIDLAEGEVTTITVVVTAQDNTISTYTIAVTRAADASLSALAVSAGTLMPAFDSDRTTQEYTVSVANNIRELTVTPTAANENATIMVQGNAVDSGSPSDPIELVAGEVTTITVVVTAQDRSENTYTIAVSRTDSIRVRIKVFLEGPLR
ncbi:MAG: cadherin-like beta sandwich domain-containing protein, partial [Chromatiales bacterium]|nr:cadherin-like beta sandwich domain-containing protein [Chromatiales bacterium]